MVLPSLPRSWRVFLSAAALLYLSATPSLAGTVVTPNTFSNGTTAEASDVNDNFTAHATEINDNATDIVAAESTISALNASLLLLTSRVASLEANATTVRSAVISGDGSIQFTNIPGLGSARTGVGDYTLTIPDGVFASVAIPIFTPISNTAEVSTSVTTKVTGNPQTSTVSLRTDAGGALDGIFHVQFAGDLP